MNCRGIRGAITVDSNTKESIVSACKDLLKTMIESNEVDVESIAGVWFTTTHDLNAEFPAVAARELGLVKTALMCGHEMNVPGSLQGCLRIMMLINTDKRNEEIVNVYLKGTCSLRGDTNISEGNSQEL